MLRLIQSNQLEELAADLCDHWEADSHLLLAADVVIVPSRGLARWLTWRLADRFGVCANVDFRFAAEWVWDMFGRLLPEVSERSPFASNVMTLRVLDFLERLPPGPIFAPVQRYLEGANGRRRLELARQIAGVFDQYLVYRPQWLEQWARGHAATSVTADAEAWQMRLWQSLVAAMGLSNLQHPKEAFFREVSQRASSGQPLALPSRLGIFAVPDLPPLYADLFVRLAQFIDVDWYVLNPCAAFWGDIRSAKEKARLQAAGDPAAAFTDIGHGLLASWGRQAREQMACVASYVGEANVEDIDAFVAPPGDRVLQRLQRAMLELAEPDPASEEWQADDRSIQCHACHSLSRQIEVLQDHLLTMFEAQPDLKPSEVVVFAVDLEATASLFDAIFGAAPPERRIPYSVSGRSRDDITSYLRGFWFLFGLPQSRFEAAAVLGFLEIPAVARRYTISGEDFALIRRWLREAGARWGLDADHRARLDLPASSRHTWQEALLRLLLGYAMPTRGAALFQEISPFDDIEGSQAECLGKLALALRDLVRAAQLLATPRTLSEWSRTLIAQLGLLFAPNDEEQIDEERLRDTLSSLERDAREAEFSSAVPLDVVRGLLEARITGGAPGALPGGRVTLSAIGPLRGIPYRVICFVGLDDAAFPRQISPIEFDLLRLQPQPGDRARRAEDRQAFLDGVLAAREVLYLSYNGRSIRDNAALPPSVLVAELLDYLARVTIGGRKQVAARFLTEHALQPFSARYFEAQDPASFASEYLDASERFRLPPDERAGRQSFFGDGLTVPADPQDSVLELSELADFLTHPVRYLLRKRLGMRIEHAEDDIPSDEPFALESRDRWNVEQVLFERRRSGCGREEAVALLAGASLLPHGEWGLRLAQACWTTVDGFASRVEQAQVGLPRDPFPITLPIGDLRLSARLERVDGIGILEFALRKTALAELITIWLQHLMLCASGELGSPRSRLLTLDNDYQFTRVADPQARLSDLVEVYRSGQSQALPLAPRSARAWMLAKEAKRMSAAQSAWTGSPPFAMGERTDVWLAAAYGDDCEELPPGFEAVAERVLRPILDHLQVGDAPARRGDAAA